MSVATTKFDPETEYKCDLCMTRNPKTASACRSCETPAPGAAKKAKAPTSSGAITSSGFTFGTAPAADTTTTTTTGAFSFGASSGFIFKTDNDAAPSAGFTFVADSKPKANVDDKKKTMNDNDDEEQEQPKDTAKKPAAKKAKEAPTTVIAEKEAKHAEEDVTSEESEDELVQAKKVTKVTKKSSKPFVEPAIAPKRSARQAALAAKVAETHSDTDIDSDEETKPKRRVAPKRAVKRGRRPVTSSSEEESEGQTELSMTEESDSEDDEKEKKRKTERNAEKAAHKAEKEAVKALKLRQRKFARFKDERDEKRVVLIKDKSLLYKNLTAQPKSPVQRPKYFGNGTVLTFGTGDMAQLGLGVNIRERKFPAVVDALKDFNIIAVSSGALHNLALTDSGEVYSWGCNDDGALGRTTKTDVEEFIPTQVEGLEDVYIIAIACGASHSLALSDDGRVFSWGAYRDLGGLIGFDEHTKKAFKAMLVPGLERVRITRIAAGESHCLALAHNGSVYYWGDVFVGRRQSSRFKQQRLSPQILAFHTKMALLPQIFGENRKLTKEDTTIVHIFTGGYTCCAISQSGLLWTWGPNNYTQTAITREHAQQGRKLEKDEPPCVLTPSIVPYFAQKKIKIIGGACSTQFTLLLTDDRRVFAVGRHAEGRLGQPENFKFADKQEQAEPLEIKSLSPAALSSEASWKPAVESKTPLHEIFSEPHPDCVVALACGEAHTLVVTAAGRVLSFGSGDTLQLGNGIDATQYGPYWVRSQQITTIPRYVLAASCGSQHSVVLCMSAEEEEDQQ